MASHRATRDRSNFMNGKKTWVSPTFSFPGDVTFDLLVSCRHGVDDVSKQQKKSNQPVKSGQHFDSKLCSILKRGFSLFFSLVVGGARDRRVAKATNVQQQQQQQALVVVVMDNRPARGRAKLSDTWLPKWDWLVLHWRVFRSKSILADLSIFDWADRTKWH